MHMHNNCAAFLAAMIKEKLMFEGLPPDDIMVTLFSPVIIASDISGLFLYPVDTETGDQTWTHNASQIHLQ